MAGRSCNTDLDKDWLSTLAVDYAPRVPSAVWIVTGSLKEWVQSSEREFGEQSDNQLSELKFSRIKINNVEAQNEFLGTHNPQNSLDSYASCQAGPKCEVWGSYK